MRTYLSIDIGTSSTKLALFDERGQLINTQSASYAVDYPRPEWAEQDPEAWWQAVCRLGPHITQVASDLTHSRSPITAIAVSGQTPGCVAVDETGHPLRKAILWLDRRATPQVDYLRREVGEARCRAVSVNRLDSYFAGAKWLWLKQAEPDIFVRTHKILQANGLVIQRLTGQAVIDPAQAGLTSPCFDLLHGHWDAELCAAIGLPLDLLPQVRPAYEVIGAVTQSAAQATGLPEGTPVVCGGADFACSCLGAGVTGGGDGALMLGTAGNLLLPGVVSRDARLLHTRHLTGDLLPFGGVLAGGNLAWFATLLGDQSPHLFARLDAEAAQVPPGSEGLVFLPYLMGERTPIWDPGARGSFVGLSSRHTRAHLYRAILEGVAFAFRQILEIANGKARSTDRAGSTGSAGSAAGDAATLNRLIATDGGARSPLWRQILSDVLGLPVVESSERGGTALGSAFLAALGAGGVSSFDEIGDWAALASQSTPDSTAARRYDAVYAVYAGLYDKLKPDFEALNHPE